MPLIRFESVAHSTETGAHREDTSTAYTLLTRFLTSHPAYPELVTELIWRDPPAHTDDRVYATIRGLKPQEAFVSTTDERSPFDVLQETLRLFHASVTDATELLDDDGWRRGTLDEFLESIVIQPIDYDADYEDLMLMIQGGNPEVEQALDLALAFGNIQDRHAVRIMMTQPNDSDTPVYFLNVRNLDSTYPLRAWQAASHIRLFYRFCNGCYVQWGYRHPLQELEALHTRLAVSTEQHGIALVATENDSSTWYHLEDDRQFHAVPHVADIYLSSRSKAMHLSGADEEELKEKKFKIELNLSETVSGEVSATGGNTREVSSLYHGQRLKERIRSLDMQRARIERELNHLKDLEQAHFLCVFEDGHTDAILNFLSDYPLSRIRNFLYLPCTYGEETRLHLLISREGASRTDLPGEISHYGQVYLRDRAWHTIGVDVYLPDGYAIRPFIGFENTMELLHAFEPDIPPEALSGKSFILRPDAEGAIEKIIVPHEDAVELTDAMQYINASMRTAQLTSISETIVDRQEAQFEKQYNGALGKLQTTQDALKNQFTIYLDGMNEDLNAALEELAFRKTEMDEFIEARKTMSEYCQSVRDLIQHPGNVLFDFLRKETELNRTLANQIGSIDYRFSIQFESFEHQSRQILHRNHETLKGQLQDLVSKIEEDGKVLQEHTEAIRLEISRIQDMPERITQGLEHMQQLQDAVKTYVNETRKVIG